MSEITIRAGSARDAAILARLHAQCFEQPWDEAAIAALLADPITFVLISEAAGEAQAFILTRVAADESEILSLGTLPRSRRSGLARQLVDAARTEAHRRGARRMFLEVAADNQPALALYETAGFVITGRRLGYYERAAARPADAVILRATLPI